ncbi:MAG: D-alanyl-D-alanine carboxypeptidase [Streptosporangiaceae bacterium]
MIPRFRGPAGALAGLATALTLATAPTLASAAIPAATAAAARASAAAASRTAPGSQPEAARLAVGGADLARPGIVVNYPGRGARRLPDVPASAFVIADANTGQVLAAKDAHGLFPPASTLKVLTAVTLIPLLNPDATVVASRRATSVEPNVVGLIAGHSYKVADLFRALLLISANDAAVSLVQATGSFDRGMALMNAEAHRLQAYDVVAKQPNGLPAAGQVVSAYDEALIARQALALPAFMRYDSTLAARFQVSKRNWVTLVNQNWLLTKYRGGLGGKIGWTVKSEATYIGLARRNGVTLIVTLLHCTPLQEITSGERLLDWGFAMAGKIRPVGVLVKPLPSVAASQRSGDAGAAKAGPATAGHGTGGAGPRGQAAAERASGGSGSGSQPQLPAAPIAIAAGLIAAVAAGLGRLAWSARARRQAGNRSGP